MKLQFDLDGVTETFDFGHCTVAGWTGRNRDGIDHHINELAAIGVAPPSAVPLYYRVCAGLLSQEASIEVVGAGTSGEVEPFVVVREGAFFLGLASDHTDRELESHSVALSKQICFKPVARTLWRFDEVADHLEKIEMRSWILENDTDTWIVYQQGTLATIRPLGELIAGSKIADAAKDGRAAGMLCGTLGAKGGVRPSRAFKMTLHDPILDRTITHAYDITELPVIS